MKINWHKIKIKELAGLVCRLLNRQGIEAVLVGGACVSIYSKNLYLSGDLDFVTHSSLKALEPLLAQIDFVRQGSRHFVHPQCPFFLEFLAPPVAIGESPVKSFQQIKTRYGTFKALTPEDSIKDRLAAFYFWNDLQALEQAVLLARLYQNQIDFNAIKDWSKKEKQSEKYRNFLKQLKKPEEQEKENGSGK